MRRIALRITYEWTFLPIALLYKEISTNDAREEAKVNQRRLHENMDRQLAGRRALGDAQCEGVCKD